MPEPEDKLSVQAALNAVMRDVQVVRKDQRNKEQGFNFRGVDDVINAVGPKLREHRVIIAPVKSRVVSTERYKTAKGTEMQGVVVRMDYSITGPDGDWLAASALGQSSDAGDKAIAKAQSVAYRVMLLQLLCIPTDEPDPDSEAHERASEQRPAQPVENPAVQEVNAAISSTQQALGWSMDQLYKDFRDWSKGRELDQAPLDWRRAFAAHLAEVEAGEAALKHRQRVTQHVAGGPYPDVPVNDLWKTVTELADSLSYEQDDLAKQYARLNPGHILANASPEGLQEFVKQLRHELDARQNDKDENDARNAAGQWDGRDDQPPPF